MNYVDPNTVASSPTDVNLSRQKFIHLRDEVLKISPLKKIYYNKQFKRINQYLLNGDTQPAVVASVDPLVISAYSSDMDAVLLLRFPQELVRMYQLEKGMKLVTTNIYFEGDKVAKDIITGEGYTHDWVNYVPMIPLFLCDNEIAVRQMTEMFDEALWDRVMRMTAEKSANKRIKPRDGFYYFTKFNLLFMIF
ncbi:MAG: hypothetical protein NC340_07460 [Ruminococcus flavefaciens]|nr:hypothetical protein [Ruminococcus flavefaciens]MCM1231631.1 hypothetical protein [Ruminococcus flavefaciens]